MKFAIINDIHLGPIDKGYKDGVQRKLMGEAEKLVKNFVKLMNKKENPEFVMNLGDSIEDVNDKDQDIKFLKKAISLLNNLSMPTYWTIGNHDIRSIDQKDIAQLLGYDKMYYSFDHSNYHFVVLSFEMTGNHTEDLHDIRAEIPDKQLGWLKDDLNSTNKPTIVFIHYGVAEDDMKGNFWFEGEPEYALLGNRKQLRKVLENNGNVIAVFNAHQHWNRMHVHHGIPYFTLTSLAENFKNDGIPSKAHTIVNLNSSSILVEVKGNDPAKFEFSFD
jgi:alkaline phosphatase